MSRKLFGWGTAVAVLAVVLAVFTFRSQTEARQATAVSGAKYSVVDTEGTNLTVVDNATNTLYFYTVDPSKEAGDDLRLRGSIDLNQVGKAVVHCTKSK
jgi:hypothetical protein